MRSFLVDFWVHIPSPLNVRALILRAATTGEKGKITTRTPLACAQLARVKRSENGRRAKSDKSSRAARETMRGKKRPSRRGGRKGAKGMSERENNVSGARSPILRASRGKEVDHYVLNAQFKSMADCFVWTAVCKRNGRINRSVMRTGVCVWNAF